MPNLGNSVDDRIFVIGDDTRAQKEADEESSMVCGLPQWDVIRILLQGNLSCP